MYAPIVADYGVRSIFIGGGTPSLLDESLITNIMAFIRRYFHVEKNAEVTIEANPGTLRHQKLNAIRRQVLTGSASGYSLAMMIC